MNSTARRNYSRRYQNQHRAIEKKYVKPVWWALKRQVSSFTGMIREQGVHNARTFIAMHLFNPHLEAILRRLYMDAGLIRAREVRGDLRLMRTKRSSFGTNDELVHAIIEYLQRYLLDKAIRPISQTTRDWVLRVLEKGIQEGKGAAEIAKETEGSVFLRHQAIRIVRTEVVRATNVGAMKAAEASPFEVVKQWVAAHDARVRHSHRLLDGQIREMEEDFKPNLSQPGDPRADGSETIQCRCVLAFIPKRDENGRLIRKPVGLQPTIDSGINRLRQFLNVG